MPHEARGWNSRRHGGVVPLDGSRPFADLRVWSPLRANGPVARPEERCNECLVLVGVDERVRRFSSRYRPVEFFDSRGPDAADRQRLCGRDCVVEGGHRTKVATGVGADGRAREEGLNKVETVWIVPG